MESDPVRRLQVNLSVKAKTNLLKANIDNIPDQQIDYQLTSWLGQLRPYDLPRNLAAGIPTREKAMRRCKDSHSTINYTPGDADFNDNRELFHDKIRTNATTRRPVNRIFQSYLKSSEDRLHSALFPWWDSLPADCCWTESHVLSSK